MYSVGRAAKTIGVSRTTVYKYCKRDRSRYASADSETIMLTEQGLAQLRLDLAETIKPTIASADSQFASGGQAIVHEREIASLTARIAVLETQHDADQRMIELLTETVTMTRRALDQEQQLRLHEMNRPSWWQRLLGKPDKDK